MVRSKQQAKQENSPGEITINESPAHPTDASGAEPDPLEDDPRGAAGRSAAHAPRVRVLVSPTPAHKGGGLLRNLLWGTAFVTTAVVSATIGAVLTLMAPHPALPDGVASGSRSLGEVLRQTMGYRVTRPVNILVMGIDRVLHVPQDSPAIFSGRSDTMLLVRVDPLQNTATILSIPRDTQVRIPDVGISKINYANEHGGPDFAARVVSQNLDDVPIDRYVRISTDAFRELVDLLGGVRVYVPYRMDYEDKTQQLKIDLQEGWQTLDGEQAEGFARFRHDGIGDVGRVQRQQQLLRSLREQILTPTVVPKIPQIVELMQTYIDTNLTMDEMLALTSFGLGLERDQFRMVMLPGRFSQPGEFVASYWLLDQEGRDRIMRDHFGITGILETGNIPLVADLRIAVQNATDDPQLGREVAAYLRSQGFNNVYVVRDWQDPQTETQIIAQRGDLQSAGSLQSVLGVGQVIPASTGDLESDLTIRVGQDWHTRLGS